MTSLRESPVTPGTSVRIKRDCWGWAEDGRNATVHCGEMVEYVGPSAHFSSYSMVMFRGYKISLPTDILVSKPTGEASEDRKTRTTTGTTKEKSAQRTDTPGATQTRIPL